jgi:hypothetical protein
MEDWYVGKFVSRYSNLGIDSYVQHQLRERKKLHQLRERKKLHQQDKEYCVIEKYCHNFLYENLVC